MKNLVPSSAVPIIRHKFCRFLKQSRSSDNALFALAFFSSFFILFDYQYFKRQFRTLAPIPSRCADIGCRCTCITSHGWRGKDHQCGWRWVTSCQCLAASPSQGTTPGHRDWLSRLSRVTTGVETSLLINVDQQKILRLTMYLHTFTKKVTNIYSPPTTSRHHSSRETHSPFYSFFHVQVIRINTCYTIIINQDFIFSP